MNQSAKGLSETTRDRRASPEESTVNVCIERARPDAPTPISPLGDSPPTDAGRDFSIAINPGKVVVALTLAATILLSAHAVIVTCDVLRGDVDYRARQIVDVNAGSHETINTAIDPSSALGGAIVVVVFCLWFLPFLTSVPKRAVIGFVVAGALYVGGAGGIEIVDEPLDGDSLA